MGGRGREGERWEEGGGRVRQGRGREGSERHTTVTTRQLFHP